MPSFNDHNCPHHLSFVQANVTLPGGDKIMIQAWHKTMLAQILFKYTRSNFSPYLGDFRYNSVSRFGGMRESK